MILSKFMQGLEILSKYYDKDSFVLEAEHDQIFLHPIDNLILAEDYKALIDLGWLQDGYDFAHEYDPNAGWYIWT